MSDHRVAVLAGVTIFVLATAVFGGISVALVALHATLLSLIIPASIWATLTGTLARLVWADLGRPEGTETD